VINLANLSILSLDESLFKKKYCFQLTSQDGTFSFAGIADENRDEWMGNLYPLTVESSATKDEVCLFFLFSSLFRCRPVFHLPFSLFYFFLSSDNEAD